MKIHKSTSSDLYLTLQDIADIAGVSKPAVANWRKRHGKEFPAPVEVVSSERQPKFSSDEVFAWLLANQKVTQEGLKAQSSSIHLKTLVAQTGRRFPVEESAFLALGLVYFADHGVVQQVLASQATDEVARCAESVGLKHFVADTWLKICSTFTTDELNSLVSAALGLVESQPVAGVVEDLIDALASKHQGVRGVELAGRSDVLPSLARQVSAIQQQVVDSIYDPMIGFASTAVASIKDNAVRVYGADINGLVLAVAELRLALHGIGAELRAVDSLRGDAFPERDVDFAFVEGAWGLRLDEMRPEDFAGRDVVSFDVLPRNGGGDALTLLDVVSHLSERGWGFVLTPYNVVMSRRFERFRHALIAQECVAAIIQLPGGLARSTQIPLVLWVVRAPGQASDSVIVVDASGAKNVVEEVALAVASVQGLELPSRLLARRVSLAESLARADFSWLPAAALKPEVKAEDIQSRLVEAEWQVRAGLEILAKSADSLQVDAGFGVDFDAPVVSLADLADWQVHRAGLHREDIVMDLWGKGSVSARLLKPCAGFDACEEVYVRDGARVLEPGDVVVWTAPKLSAVAVPDDGQTYVVKGAGGVQVFRLDPAVWNPHYLAAVVSNQTAEVEPGSVVNRVRLQDVHVRRLNLLGQERVLLQFKELTEVRRQAQNLSETIGVIMNALTDYQIYCESDKMGDIK